MRRYAYPNAPAALQAKPNMEKSSVVDNASGKSVPSEIRTSTGTFFPKVTREPWLGQPCTGWHLPWGPCTTHPEAAVHLLPLPP
jgi:hypothetical protein